MTHRTAVIGAGLAGLACARVMRRAGCYVEVFEQTKAIAGRMATTRMGIVPFDHGAQYLSSRSDKFRTYIKELEGSGYASSWEPNIAFGEEGGTKLLNWYVGLPGMSAVVRPLAESVRIHFEKRVHTIKREDRSWYIWFDDQTKEGPFSAVVVAVPAPEAKLILGHIEHLAEPLERVRMAPCWSLMLRFDQQVLPEFDVYSDMSQAIRWIGRNNCKPGRKGKGENLVIHASQAWSRETADVEPEVVAEEMWSEVCHLLSSSPIQPLQSQAHLWEHGLVDSSLGETYLFSSADMVGVAGDWCLGRLAEHAFESGTQLGKAVVDALN